MKRLLLSLVLVLCATFSAYSRGKVQGVASITQKVVTTGLSSSNSFTRVLASATITVYAPSGQTSTLATLYSNATGTPKSNSFVAGTDGSYFFYTDAVSVDVRVSGITGVNAFTISDIAVSSGDGLVTMACGGANDTTALSVANTAGGTIVIPKGITCASNSQTISVPLNIQNGGLLKPVTGQTVTLTGSQQDGVWRRFTNATATLGTISFNGNKNLNLIYPEWWNATADNSTDNAMPLQAAVTAQSTLGGGFGGGTLKFSVGTYLTSVAIVPLQVKGIRWEGSGRIGTVIKSSGSDSAVRTNGCWYSTFSQIQFSTTNVLSGKGVFELDGNYDLSHTQGVQGNTFDNCLFDGGGSTYAFTLVRQGGSAAQGSENTFLNCHWLRTTTACYHHVGFNAIANTFIGGDMQAFDKNGIEYAGGSVIVLGTSFESTNAYTQVINSGYDINTLGSGVYEFSIISGCRSESLRFFNGVSSQGAVITGFNWTPAAYTGWTALTPFALNAIQFKVAVNGSMKAYRASTAGTSGASEPTWPNSGTVADGSVVWTQFDLNVVNLPVGSLISSTGFIGIPLTAGIPGNFLAIGTVNIVTTITANYTAAISDDTIVGITTGGSFTVTLPDASTTPNPPTGKRMYFKKGTTDANTLSVQAAGGNGIDGSGAAVIIPGSSEGFLALEYDSTAVQWRIIGRSAWSGNAGSALSISTNTITPTSLTHQVGAGLIKTITVPSGFASGNCIQLVPTAAFTTDATGNVSKASTAVVGQVMTVCLLGTTWYPSY